MTVFKGTSAANTFIGTDEDDSFLYIADGDTADGGAGSDIISLSLGTFTVPVYYNAIQAATATGVTLPNSVTVRNMERLGSLATGSGNDILTISVAQGPFNWMGGDGFDRLRINFSGATDSVFNSAQSDGFSFVANQWGSFGYAQVQNVEAIDVVGSRYGDYFIGGTQNDRLNGYHGDDVLNPGAAGADLVDGGTGFDRIELDYGDATSNIVYDATVAATASGGRLFNGTIVRNVEGIRTIATGSGNDKLIVDNGTRDFTWQAGTRADILVADYHGATGVVHSAYATTPTGLAAVITSPSMPDGFRGTAYGIEQLFITGSKFADDLQGTWGNDRLDGGAGADGLEGLKGNDTYIVDNVADTVVERVGDGTDTVYASVDFSLSGSYLEYLVLTGDSDIHGFGNDLDNRIIGNGGDNRIVGGRGNDTLTGGGGADNFAFAAGSGRDRIVDFHASQGDTLDLNAYHAQATAAISQHGSDTWVDLGNGNLIVLSNVTATDTAFLNHIIW
ncbi:MAG: calcium-binding protein [Asticcacaulis sp.]|nr:calcium-binding protein [Asticcacaulis sp.]